jgi:hypothetical protein
MSDDEPLVLYVSARYKPENPQNHETDQYGYTETEMMPAMEFHGLSELEEQFIAEFVPVVVEKAKGFAGFYEKATKNISLIERLENIRLPEFDEELKENFREYLEQKRKAERLETEIQETENLIDAIVFDLYDLTEEEVETVLDSLDTPEDERTAILEHFRNLQDSLESGDDDE